MAGDNDKDKKGFSGLSDLASEVSGLDEPIKPESKAEAKPSTTEQPSHPQHEKPAPDPDKKTEESPQPVETVTSADKTSGSGGKWILGIIAVAFVIWLINNEGQNSRTSSYNPPSTSQSNGYPQSSPAPAVRAPGSVQNAGLQYTRPSVGTNNVLSVPKIRWCIREGIRIEAMRSVIDSSAEVGKFNRIVDDYNSRCGSYRYRQGSQSRAERDLEPYRSQIVAEALREARKWGSSYQPSYSSGSQGTSTSSAPEKPSAQYTREAQQLLTDLGYDPGPIDGDYGRRTAAAVKAFQRDSGITQDGWIDQYLLSLLRRVAVQRSYQTSPSVGSSPAQKTKQSSGIPANAHVGIYGTGWDCNRGFRKYGNECVEVKAPPNAHIDVYGSGWDCDRGYRKVSNKCVEVNVPLNAHIDVYGNGWDCDRGFSKVGNECVQVRVPVNAHIDVYGSGWDCDRGFRKVGNGCVKVDVPANAHIDVYGSGWDCDRGFRNIGNECIKFSVPANAHIDVYGSGWDCDRDYQKVGDKCVSIFGQ